MERPLPHPRVCSLILFGQLADGQAVTASLCMADISVFLTLEFVLRPEQALKWVRIPQFVCQISAWNGCFTREKLGWNSQECNPSCVEMSPVKQPVAVCVQLPGFGHRSVYGGSCQEKPSLCKVLLVPALTSYPSIADEKQVQWSP